MTINAFWLMLGALGIYAIAYRYYSAFIARKVLALDDARITPAHRLNDGHNYHPTNKWILWGHHFAAIAGAGPLIGPVLAAQFGFLPGFLWLVFGVCLAGAVQDFIILVASVRRNGKSLAEIAREEISPLSGAIAMIAILFIIVVSLAVLGFVVVKALADSPWGAFTILMSIPIALFMGLYMYRFRKGHVGEASVIGVALLVICVFLGGWFQPGGPWAGYAKYLTLSENGITTAMVVYGFIASVLPVWMLLCPRDYLSSYMKVGTIGLIVLAVFAIRPEIQQPAFTSFIHGGGPIVKGAIFPFVFITIACGAISGFHSLVSSGTTPKMIGLESQCRPIGYGAMLMESLVGVARIFGQFPGLEAMMSYFYHFVIMFEALFVLTTIDTGTRIGRFLVQEVSGRVYKPMSKTDWMPGTIIASAVVVAAWSYFIYTGTIQTLWPMFGVANQLLAVVALAVGTTVIINEGKAKYAWVTLAPMCFVGTTTLCAGFLSVKDIFIPLAQKSAKPGDAFQGILLSVLTVIMMSCVIVILADSVPRWLRLWETGRPQTLDLLRLPSREAAAEERLVGIIEPSL